MKKETINKFFSFIASISLLVNSLLSPFVVSTSYAQETTPELTPVVGETAIPKPSSKEPIVLSTSEATIVPEETPTATPEVTPGLEPTASPIEESTPSSSPDPESEIQTQSTETLTTSIPTAISQEPEENGEISAVVLENTQASSVEEYDLEYQEEGSATIQTDKLDYAPTDTVLITGSGFLPNTEYGIEITSDTGNFRFSDKVKSDESGSLFYSYQLDGTYRPDYLVEIYKISGAFVTSTTFTDGVIDPNLNWPNDNEWQTPNSCVSDPEGDEHPSSTDLAGIHPVPPAVGFASDSFYQYFRERINGDPSGPGGFRQYAWVVLFQTISPEYQFLGSLNGLDDMVQLWQNTSPDGAVDFSPLHNDPAETLVWGGSASSYARIVPAADGKYYVDWAIPISELTSRGITPNTTKFFATSANANNYNKDHLLCYEAMADLSVVKSDNPDPVVSGGTLTYTLDIHNAGPDIANDVVVTDTLPSGFTVVSVVSSQGSCSDIVEPNIQCELGNLNNGAGATVTIVGMIEGLGVVTNHTTVDLDQSVSIDTNPNNNFDSEDTTINPASATLNVLKHVINDNGGTKNASDFSINVAGNNPTPTSFFGVEDPGIEITLYVGPYSVSEIETAGYSATYSGDCDGTIAAGESKTCIITNDDIAPTLTLIKEVINDNEGSASSSDWILHASGEGGFEGVSPVTNTVKAGETYFLTEENGPLGYFEGGWVCDGGGTQVDNSIILEVGEQVFCTIINDDIPGRIFVDKVTFPGGSSQSFDFEINDFNQYSQFFDLTDSSALFDSGPISAGIYSVSEIVPNGWDQTGAYCSDGSLVDNIDVNLGEEVTCTFENTQKGHIIVDKVVDPSDDQTTFIINVLGSGITGDATRSIVGGGLEDFEVTPGTYSVTENSLFGWFPEYQCIDIEVDPGETEYCTINNTKYSSITIIKDSNPDNSQDFSFTTQGNGISGFILDDDDSDSTYSNTETFDNLLPGSFTISEVLPVVGWDFNDVVCGSNIDGFNPNVSNEIVSFNLRAGEDVVCTYTNTQKGKIVVVKETLPDGEEQDFEFVTTYGPNFFLSDGQSNESDFLSPGNHSVNESVLSGWDLTDVMCDDGSNPNLINLSPGENITCTFTNTQRGIIEGAKINDLDGDGDLKEGEPSLNGWTIFIDENGDGILDSNERSTITQTIGGNDGEYQFDNVVPETYSVCEVEHSDWQRTYPALSNCQTVDVPPGPVQADPYWNGHVDFGNFHKTSISGQKWNDLDGDGVKDTNEPGIEGWKISLCTNGGDGGFGCFENTFTDVNGNYEFQNVGHGTFRVVEENQTDWTQTYPLNEYYEFQTQSGIPVSELDFGNKSPLRLKAFKVICDSEEYLPNWGNHGGTIDENTAQNWVDTHPEHCRIEDQWQFQWAGSGAGSSGTFQTNTSLLGVPWQTFVAEQEIKINDFSNLGERIEIREVFNDNSFYPFSNDDANDKSAEFYCSGDVYHYDNWEWITNLQYGETYYCVGFNATGTGTIKVTKDVLGPGGEDINDNHNFDVELNGGLGKIINEQTTVEYEVPVGIEHEITEISDPNYDFWKFYLNGIFSDGKVTLTEHGQVAEFVALNKQKPSLIQGRKYRDLNQNGTHELNDGEERLNSWDVRLYDEDWLLQSEVTTSNTGQVGQYRFDGLMPGTYYTCEVLQNNWTQTGPVLGAGTVDNNGDPIGDGLAVSNQSNAADEAPVCWQTIIIEPNQSKGWLKFGNIDYGSIKGFKWNDLDGNGIYNEGEEKISGWMIKLYKDTEIAWTNTNSLGEYYFKDLVPGEYEVCEVEKSGWVRKYPSFSKCQTVIVNPSEDKEDIRFGNQELILDLSLEKSNIVDGNIVTYTLVVTNDSNQTLSDLIIMDALPGGINYIPSSSKLDNVSIFDPTEISGTLQWYICFLPVGESKTLTYQAEIGGDVVEGDHTNIAIAKAKYCNDVERGALLEPTSQLLNLNGAINHTECEELESDLVTSTITIVEGKTYSGNLTPEVLGIYTELPATGSKTEILIFALSIGIIGLIFKRKAQDYEKN